MENNNSQVSTLSAEQQEIITSLVLNGDLSKMSPPQKVQYYNNFCNVLGLNPMTQPFDILTLSGKVKLYPNRSCTEQLRKMHGVSVYDMKHDKIGDDLYKVTSYARDASGKTDVATGVLSIAGLKGEALSNAIMKCETKSKRRVTLSICGLGMMDESEIEGMQQGAANSDIITTETIDTEYEEIDTADIPEEIVNAVKDADTIDNLKKVWSESSKELQDKPTFKQLVNKRKADLELSALQQKFGTDGK